MFSKSFIYAAYLLSVCLSQSLFFYLPLHKSSSIGMLVMDTRKNSARVAHCCSSLIRSWKLQWQKQPRLSLLAHIDNSCAATLWHGGVLLWKLTATQQNNIALISERWCCSTCWAERNELRCVLNTHLLFIKGPYHCYYILFTFVNNGHIGYINLMHFSQKKLNLWDIVVVYILSIFNRLKMCDVI